MYSELQSTKYEKCVFSFNFFNKDISFDIFYTVFKLDMPIPDTIMKGTMPQFFYLGPRFYFMKCRK